MIFFIFGTDHFRCQEKLRELKTGFIQKRDQTGLNVVLLDGEKLTPDELRQEAMATPFLSEKKMVVVKNVLSNKKISSEIADFLKEKKDKIDNVVCFLDLLNPEKKKDFTGPLFKLLDKEKFKWEFNLLPPREVVLWLKNYIAKNNLQIEPQAVFALSNASGNDLFQLSSELDKMTAYRNGRMIRVEDVQELVRVKDDENIFNLVDAFGQKNKSLALKLTAGQLVTGNHPLVLLGAISRQFKILLKIKSGAKSAAEIKIHPFVFQKALSQSQGFSLENLKQIQNDLLSLEQQLKSGNKNPELLFDLFIMRHC